MKNSLIKITCFVCNGMICGYIDTIRCTLAGRTGLSWTEIEMIVRSLIDQFMKFEG